jgi:hypothetical protein
MQIRDIKLNFLIQLTSIIARCVFLCLGQVQTSSEVLYLWGNYYLNLQGISPYLLFHLELTSRGFISTSLYLHLNPPRVTEIISLE